VPISGAARIPASGAWPLAGIALAVQVAMAALAVTDGDVFLLALVPGPLVAAAMGALITARQPRHPMGALLSLIGIASGMFCLVFAYARAAVIHYPGTLPLARPLMWMTCWDWVPPAVLSGLVIPLIFPDGRLLSRRWRPALWGAAAYGLLSIVGNAFAPGTTGGWFHDLPDPYAIPGPAWGPVLDAANACGLATAIAAIASVLVRWHRAGHVVRQQLKWLAAAMPLGLAGGVLAQFFPDTRTLGLVVWALASALMATAIGLAVLRYRLYDIDLLLSRAAGYGVLSVAIAGLYLAVVAVAGGSVGNGSGLSLQLLATVVAAAVMLPVRGRLQRRVERLFFGDRGAPYAAMARLAQQVEAATIAEPVLNSVARVVADTLRLPYAAVQLRSGDCWADTASWGQPPSPADLVCFPMAFQRETVGRLVVGQRAPRERLGADDERLLASLARQVAPAAHAVALRKALDASRTVLVTAREEERRRLRRDLHDELGPRIAGLVLGLDAACALAAGQCHAAGQAHEAGNPPENAGNPDLRQLLAVLKAESQRTVDEVRRIGHGLRPPQLDQLGLAGTLRQEAALLERQVPGLAITVHAVPADLPDLAAAVEVAAYRIAAEAVTNVARHAHARHCEIRVAAITRGELPDTHLGPSCHLVLDVCDDGDGMPDGWRAGVGIASMRERAAELGGTLLLEPGTPRGTRVMACLPVVRGLPVNERRGAAAPELSGAVR
jgi:two-component system NarL family sensor kinase